MQFTYNCCIIKTKNYDLIIYQILFNFAWSKGGSGNETIMKRCVAHAHYCLRARKGKRAKRTGLVVAGQRENEQFCFLHRRLGATLERASCPAMQSTASAASSQYSSSGIGSSISFSLSPTPSAASSDTLSFSSSGGDWSWAVACGRRDDARDADWCEEEEAGSKARRRGRKRVRQRREPVSQRTCRDEEAAARKKAKNDREKERVLHVREQYDILAKKLGDRVERGSGHFSKVLTLKAAIKYIRELREDSGLVESPSAAREVAHSDPPPEPGLSLPPLPPPLSAAAAVNLSCDEQLEPELHPYSDTPTTSFDSLFTDELPSAFSTTPDDILPAYSTTPYFTYSSANDFPPIFDSSCLYPFPGGSPTLPPPPPPPHSSLISPEMTAHHVSGANPVFTGGLSPSLGLSPPPPAQHPYQCGSDVWLAIGCN